MPDLAGWHDEAFEHDGKRVRWHMCSGDPDTLVDDTETARAEHERVCNARREAWLREQAELARRERRNGAGA